MSIYKGGYLTIDCGGGDILTDAGITISGVYEAVKETIGKVVILSNVVIGGSTFKYFVLTNLVEEADDVAWSSADITIYIANTDAVYAVAN